MKYKYIFFDWGYTLISKFKNVDSEINNILSKYNVKWDKIFNKWKSYQILLSLGKIKEDEMYNDLSLLFNIRKKDIQKIENLLLESHILEEITRNLIRKLYNKGYYLGIITNNSTKNVRYILKRENIEQYFKKIIISEEVKERKPSLKIYLKAFEGIPKEEYEKIIFVSDELLEDLIPAKLLGIKTVWFEQNINNKWKKKEEVLIEADYKINKIEEILKIVKI